MCGIIRKSTAVQTWEATGSLLHFTISSQLKEECMEFLSEQIEDSLVSFISGSTFSTFKVKFVDGANLFCLIHYSELKKKH